MAQAPRHGADRAPFVREIVSDPKAVPDVMLLYGYLGASSEEDHERLYLSPDLTNYVEVPQSAILHQMVAPKEQDPHGGVTLWVKKDAQLINKMAPAAEALAHYFAGAIQAGAPGVAAVQQPTTVNAPCLTQFQLSGLLPCPPPTNQTPCMPCVTGGNVLSCVAICDSRQSLCCQVASARCPPPPRTPIVPCVTVGAPCQSVLIVQCPPIHSHLAPCISHATCLVADCPPFWTLPRCTITVHLQQCSIYACYASPAPLCGGDIGPPGPVEQPLQAQAMMAAQRCVAGTAAPGPNIQAFPWSLVCATPSHAASCLPICAPVSGGAFCPAVSPFCPVSQACGPAQLGPVNQQALAMARGASVWCFTQACSPVCTGVQCQTPQPCTPNCPI